MNIGMCMTLAFEIIVACFYKAGTQAAVLNIRRPVTHKADILSGNVWQMLRTVAGSVNHHSRLLGDYRTLN